MITSGSPRKMGLTHRLAATVIKFGELKNGIKDSYAVCRVYETKSLYVTIFWNLE